MDPLRTNIKHNENIAVKQPVVTSKKKHQTMLFIKCGALESVLH